MTTPHGRDALSIGIPYCEQIGALLQELPESHLVLCGYKGKRKAAYPGWDKRRPTSNEAIHHAEKNLIGIIPTSIHYTVLDVDEGNPLELARGLRPDYFTPSGTRGRGHLWFYDDEARPNSAWKLRGQSGNEWAGEIRSGNGYLILWFPDIITARLMMQHGELKPRTFNEITQWLNPPATPPPPPKPMQSTPGTSRALDRAVAIVNAISPGSYDTWIQVGMCLEGSARKGELDPGNAFTLWRNWSARVPDKYPGDDELTRKWASFRGGNPRTLGTLVQQYGGGR